MSAVVSDPMKTVPSSKDYPWYIPNINLQVRCLLEKYNHVSPDKVRHHINTIRDKAWAIRPYPYTGMGQLIDPVIARSIAYPSIISRLQHGELFLDINCPLGYVIRRLILDGAPSENLHTVDVENHWDLGHKPFQDKLDIDLIEEDILHPGDRLKHLQGRVDIISVTAVLQNYTLEGQLAVAVELSLLSCGVGSLIVGYQVGGPRTKIGEGPAESTYNAAFQTPDTLNEMWKEVGRRTGSEWRSEARFKKWEEVGYDPEETEYLGEDIMMLEFVVTRVR